MITTQEIEEMIKEIEMVYYDSSNIQFEIYADKISIHNVPGYEIMKPKNSIAYIRIEDIKNISTIISEDVVMIHLKCKYSIVIYMTENRIEFFYNFV